MICSSSPTAVTPTRACPCSKTSGKATSHQPTSHSSWRPAVPPSDLTFSELEQLATYNAERARGIMHTPEWQAKMARSEEHTSELQSHSDLVCRLLLEKKKRRNSECTSRHA